MLKGLSKRLLVVGLPLVLLNQFVLAHIFISLKVLAVVLNCGVRHVVLHILVVETLLSLLLNYSWFRIQS